MSGFVTTNLISIHSMKLLIFPTLFPLPLQGHMNPILQLAEILYTRGFSITFIHTKFNSPDTTKYPHFTFHAISDGVSEHEDASKDVVSMLVRLNLNCVEPSRERLANLQNGENKDKKICCLITDAAWYFSQSVADELKIPRIVLRTGSITSFLVFSAFPLLVEKGYLPKQESRLHEPLQEFPPLKVKDLPTINTRNAEDFYNLVSSMVSETKISSGIIWNSSEELEQASIVKIHQDFPIPSYPIGPFHKYFTTSSTSLLAEDQSTISWLDKQSPKSVLYVSFGSIVVMDENEFLEMSWGLANSEQPFLWVIRKGLVGGSELLPSKFLEMVGDRGHIVKWAPQQEVLAHKSVGGFWTHNDWNSTLECISEGIPMICSPCFTDQLVSARYVIDVWKVGFGFERKLERGEVKKTIRRLMVESDGEEARQRIKSLKEKVHISLKKGGSSHDYLDDLVNHILKM